MSETVLLQKSWLEPIGALPAAAQASVYRALINYGCDGVRPELPTTADPTAAMAYGITLGIISQMPAQSAAPAAPAAPATISAAPVVRETPESPVRTAPAATAAPVVKETPEAPACSVPAATATASIPTLEDVISYWKSRGYTGDPRRFYDYNGKYSWSALSRFGSTWQELADRWAAKERPAAPVHSHAAATSDTCESDSTVPTLAEVVQFWHEHDLPGNPRKWYAAKAERGWQSRGEKIRDWRKLALANAAYLKPNLPTHPVQSQSTQPVQSVQTVDTDPDDDQEQEIQEVAYDIDDLLDGKLDGKENVSTGTSGTDSDDDLPF